MKSRIVKSYLGSIALGLYYGSRSIVGDLYYVVYYTVPAARALERDNSILYYVSKQPNPIPKSRVSASIVY